MTRSWWVAALGVVLVAGVARADDAQDAKKDPKQDRSGWRAYKSGGDLLDTAPIAAVIDGTWSIATQLDTTLIDHTWTSPRPFGTLGHYSRRILYGTSWTLMLAMEALIVATASNGDLSWIGEATYRTDWILPVDTPACPRPGANGGCGVGMGSVTFFQLKPRGSHWWYEAGGGWIEQRVLDDPLRTLTDSTWVLSPFSMVYEVRTDRDQPVATSLFLGPGVYGGMHNASVHPTVKGEDLYKLPWTELIPLEGGIGPGARGEIDVIFGRHLKVDADLTFAPLVLGDATEHPNHAAAPLDYSHHGLPIWRRFSAGIGWIDPKLLPVRPSLEFYAAELSERRVDRLGYRGFMFRFDVPLRAPGSK